MADLTNVFEVSTDRDCLTAHAGVKWPREALESKATFSDFLDFLAGSHKITFGILKEEATEFFEEASADIFFKEKNVLIAKGIPAKNGVDGRIEWERDFFARKQVVSEDGTVDHRRASLDNQVDEGEIVARVIPPVPGELGTDVRGNRIRPVPGRSVNTRAGKGAKLENGLFIAEVDGQLSYKNDVITVASIFHVEGDVNYGTGNIDFPGKVDVRGGLGENFVIKARHDVIIGTFVEGGSIMAGGGIQVRGGIVGKDKSRIESESGLTAKYIQDSVIRARGDVVIEAEVMRSSVNTLGWVRVEKGKIAGGEIVAAEGIDVNHAGNENGARTFLTVGINSFSRKEFLDVMVKIEKVEASLNQINSRIGPLRDKVDLLPEGKREVVTKLIRHADDTAKILQKLEDERDELELELAENPDKYIIVRGILNHGVTLQIASYRKVVGDPIKGPIKVVFNEEIGEFEFAPYSQRK